MPTIVVGATPDSGAANALRAASALSESLDDTELILVFAHDNQESSDDATDKLREWHRTIVSNPHELHLEVVLDDPAQAILNTASKYDSMLIAVGTHQHSPWHPKHTLGGTLSSLLRHSTLPVMVCPATETPPAPIHNIVVGFEDSPASHTALQWTRHLADRIGAAVTAVAVADFEPMTESAASAQHQINHATQIALEQLHSAIDKSSGTSTIAAQARYGHRARILVELADDADLLVLGNKQHGPIGQVILGSTTRQCVTRSSNPVIAVPASKALE